jgi:hypothetical protein
MFLWRRLGVEALKISARPRRLTRNVVRVREGGRREGKTGRELARKVKELPPLLSLLAPVPRTSTGLPLIKLVGTGEGAVADLRAQRARDGREELQPQAERPAREKQKAITGRERDGAVGEGSDSSAVDCMVQ